ncbi:SRPBCC domain-containing protein [Psychrobacillus sp. FJAT-21963]|uniref:SRPBCC family protein n=1 Tax=Psychrobacillus sp. FJAT-21963 TaxID=1712028 RepID=UPI000702075E|nr:SRPBCC domain-containing protein [Psychrobacillus sp. FJAT-21963]KQL36111.1 ATPase [Psychrobacillus sp. FJAT-21963]
MKTTSNEKAVTNEVTINAPLNLVWYAWTISERVSEWFASETVVIAKEGGAYELYFVPGNKTGMNTKGCKIIKLVDEKELVFTWKGPDQFKDIMNNENELTIVNVSFESVNENSTKVCIHHTGFKDDESWTDAFQWHQMAWSGVLSSLKSVLEKGEGNLCCQPVK